VIICIRSPNLVDVG